MITATPTSVTATLYWRALRSDPWTQATSAVEVLSATFCLAPDTPTCRFRLRYGFIHQAGLYGAGGVVVAPSDFRGKWIRVDVYDGSTTVTWYGYCPTAEEDIAKAATVPTGSSAGAALATGDATFTAYGTEFFLKNTTMDRCYVERNGSLVEHRRILGFNREDRKRNEQVVGNRSTAAVGGYYGFHQSDTNQWTALTALQHVLLCLYQQTGISVSLAGQYAYLANVVEAWSGLEGKTYYEILSAILKPSRGFAWYLWDTVLTVVSISDAAVGALIPANANVVSLTLDGSYGMAKATIKHLDNVHFDYIVVRGERLRVMFTIKDATGFMVPGYTGAEVTTYQALTDDDIGNEQYDHIFCRLVMPDDWNGCYASGDVVIPRWDPVGAAPDWLNPQNLLMRDLCLDRTIPMFEPDSKQPRKPMVWFEHDGSYYRADDPDSDAFKGCTISVLDDGVGIKLRPQYPHYWGLNHYVGASKKPAVADWAKIEATVSMYTDEFVRVQVSALEAEPGEIVRTKVIDVPGCHYWVAAPYTTISWDATGPTQTGVPVVYRNDVPYLQTIAALARVWYGRRRAELDVEYSRLVIFNRLGHVIKEAYSGGIVTPAGTILSKIAYDFADQRTQFSTEWGDLDLAAFASSRRRGGGNHRREDDGAGSRVQALEDDACVTPVLFGGGGGGGGTVLLKVTGLHSDSPASGVRMFKGDVYGNGTGAAATLTNVTVRIPGIAADVTSPSCGAWSSVPAVGGIKTTATWVGASLTHTNDTVYEAIGMVLVI